MTEPPDPATLRRLAMELRAGIDCRPDELARALEAAAEMAERSKQASEHHIAVDAIHWRAIHDLTAQRDAARVEVEQLRAENERLAALAVVSPDDVAAVVAENDRMHAAFDQALKTLHGGKGTVHSVACTWCGQHWPKLTGESYESMRRYTNAHAEQCPANEIRIERDRLREQVHVLTAANRAAELRMSLAIDERNRFETEVEQLRADSERRIDALVQDVRLAQYERDRAQGAPSPTTLHRCARCNAYLTSSDEASAVEAALAAHRTVCPGPPDVPVAGDA